MGSIKLTDRLGLCVYRIITLSYIGVLCTPRSIVPMQTERQAGEQAGRPTRQTDLERVVALGCLARKHDAIRPIEDGIGHVARFGARGPGRPLHALQHLRRRDDRHTGAAGKGGLLSNRRHTTCFPNRGLQRQRKGMKTTARALSRVALRT